MAHLTTNEKAQWAEKLTESMALQDVAESVLDEAIDFICQTMKPEDVFSEDQLQDWAERNGWEPGEE